MKGKLKKHKGKKYPEKVSIKWAEDKTGRAVKSGTIYIWTGIGKSGKYQ